MAKRQEEKQWSRESGTRSQCRQKINVKGDLCLCYKRTFRCKDFEVFRGRSCIFIAAGTKMQTPCKTNHSP